MISKIHLNDIVAVRDESKRLLTDKAKEFQNELFLVVHVWDEQKEFLISPLKHNLDNVVDPEDTCAFCKYIETRLKGNSWVHEKDIYKV